MQDRLLDETNRFFETIRHDDRGVGVIYGADSSTRSAVIEHCLSECSDGPMIAVVDAARRKPVEFLGDVLAQYGYAVDSSSEDDLRNMLQAVLRQCSRGTSKPVLIVCNTNRMYPHTLNVLCQLAELRNADRYTLNLVMVDDRYYQRILQAPSMQPIATRLAGCFELRTMGTNPVLYISSGGILIDKITITDARTLIGRSGFCDVRIDDEGISRQHAILRIHDGAIVLMDLRSKNGVSVNSQRVASAVLHDSDIVEIGDYRLKISIPYDYQPAEQALIDVADTSRMQTLEDARKKKQRAGQHALTAASKSG